MARIEKTDLPGLGVRYDMLTSEGLRVGVVHHRAGRRQFFVCPPDDPDSAFVNVNLTEDEAHSLIDILGGSQVVEGLARLQQHIEGLAIDWLPVEAGFAAARATIGDLRVRTRTGVSIVAVLRGDIPHPAPDPSFSIEAGDTLVVVGTPEGIQQVVEIIRRG
jgi:TrkA domain protein